MMLLSGCGNDKPKTSDASLASKSVSSTESASSDDSVIPSKNDYSKRTYNIVKILDHVKLDGRWEKTTTTSGEPCTTYDHTGQMIAFNADCKGDVSLKLNIRVSSTGGKDEQYFLIVVDGVDQPRAMLKCTPGKYQDITLTLAKGLKKGNHSFKVYRQTESYFAPANLVSITMNGVPTKRPADSDLYIEFLGDSITAGYGNLADNTEQIAYPRNSSGTDTYAFVAARELGADFSAICRSGLACSYGHSGLPIAYYWNKVSWSRGSDDYNFERQPNVVVIELGTNDYDYYDKQGIAYEDLYKHEMELIALVRKTCPNAKIVWVLGMMNPKANDDCVKACEDSGGAAAGIYSFIGLRDTTGGGWHPSKDVGHAETGKDLAAFIKTIL